VELLLHLLQLQLQQQQQQAMIQQTLSLPSPPSLIDRMEQQLAMMQHQQVMAMMQLQQQLQQQLAMMQQQQQAMAMKKQQQQVMMQQSAMRLWREQQQQHAASAGHDATATAATLARPGSNEQAHWAAVAARHPNQIPELNQEGCCALERGRADEMRSVWLAVQLRAQGLTRQGRQPEVGRHG
jgi:hypothetical protein